MLLNNALKAWIELQELPKHIGVQLRFILGGVLAWYATGSFDWPVFLITLLAVFLITNGSFISNEYFDYDTDSINSGRIGGEKQGVTSTGGTRVLVEGLISRKQAIIGAVICLLLAIPLGLLLQFYFDTGAWTIPLGVTGMLIGWFYTAPPFKAAYRGGGEVFMTLGYGLLIYTGYYLQAGHSWLPLVAALPRIVSVLPGKLIRSFPDSTADAIAGKRTLAVIFGKEKMSRVYVVLLIVTLLSFIAPLVALLTPFTTTRLLVSLINIIPIAYLFPNIIAIRRGEWRTRSGLNKACKRSFIGGILIALSLVASFFLVALLEHI